MNAEETAEAEKKKAEVSALLAELNELQPYLEAAKESDAQFKAKCEAIESQMADNVGETNCNTHCPTYNSIADALTANVKRPNPSLVDEGPKNAQRMKVRR